VLAVAKSGEKNIGTKVFVLKDIYKKNKRETPEINKKTVCYNKT
jgi:hypothetical protein